MSVTERGRGWQVYVKVGDRRYRVMASTEAKGKAMEAEIRAAIEAGREVDLEQVKALSESGEKTLQQAVDFVHARHWRGTRGEITAMKNIGSVMGILGAQTAIAALNDEDVDRLITELEAKGNSNGTINRKLAALSRVITFAIQRKWRTERLDLQRRPEPKGRIRYLSAGEEVALLTTTRNMGYDEAADVFACLIDLGCRVSELLGIAWQDVTPHGVSFWRTKNDSPRTVPMTKRVTSILTRRQLAGCAVPFAITYEALRRVWDRVRAQLALAGDPQWVIHMLRHTCASRLVQRGVPLLVVKDWMGHKTIQVTMRYAHLCPSNLASAVLALEPPEAPLAELADAHDSKSCSLGSVGSTPTGGTSGPVVALDAA